MWNVERLLKNGKKKEVESSVDLVRKDEHIELILKEIKEATYIE